MKIQTVIDKICSELFEKIWRNECLKKPRPWEQTIWLNYKGPARPNSKFFSFLSVKWREISAKKLKILKFKWFWSTSEPTAIFRSVRPTQKYMRHATWESAHQNLFSTNHWTFCGGKMWEKQQHKHFPQQFQRKCRQKQ